MGASGADGTGHESAGTDFVHVGRYAVNLPEREVLCGDRRIQLPWRGFEALQMLIEAKGEVVNREELFARLWPGITVGESSLNQCIAKLRRDLGEPPEGGLIETVARRGYRLKGVQEPAPGVQPEPVLETVSVARCRPSYWRSAWVLGVVALAGVGLFYLWSWHTRHIQAQALLREGFRQVRDYRAGGLGAASTLFRQALDLDNGLSLAYAGLAEAMARSVEPAPGQAWVMAERAMHLDPHCGECRAIAGWIRMTRDWRFGEAKRYLDEAVSLEPNNPRILLWHAQMLACGGEFDRALAEIDRARAIDVKQPAVVTMRAGILYLSGRFDDAIAAARESLGLKPDNPAAYGWIYRSCLQLRRVEEALAAKAALNAAFLGLSPDARFEMERRWGDAYGRGGLQELVLGLLAGTSAKPALDHQRYERATWKMWIGEREGALQELEHIFDFRPFDAIYVGVDPMFAPLRAESRFRKLLARMELDGGVRAR